jgi:hypothetical protein
MTFQRDLLPLSGNYRNDWSIRFLWNVSSRVQRHTASCRRRWLLSYVSVTGFLVLVHKWYGRSFGERSWSCKNQRTFLQVLCLTRAQSTLLVVQYIYIYIYCAVLKRVATPSDFHIPLPSIVPFAHSETYFTYGCGDWGVGPALQHSQKIFSS